MKLLILLLSAGFLHLPTEKLMLIDRQLKKPAVQAEQFTFGQYVGRTFPIYTEDLAAVVSAAEAVAKKLGAKTESSVTDTVNANHTKFIITRHGQPYKSVSVRLLTRIDEQQLTCGFELIQEEYNNRKAQRVLLNLSSYLSEN